MENTNSSTTMNSAAESGQKNSSNMMGLVVVAALVILAGSVFAYKMKKSDVTGMATNTSAGKTAEVMVSTAPTDTTAVTTHQTYKDGSYDMVGNYVSPGGPEKIEVKVTLKNNVIVDVSVIPMGDRPVTKRFQDEFISNYEPMVMGKNIDEVHLTKVAGASLTPKGFDDALQQIKTKAKI